MASLCQHLGSPHHSPPCYAVCTDFTQNPLFPHNARQRWADSTKMCWSAAARMFGLLSSRLAGSPAGTFLRALMASGKLLANPFESCCPATNAVRTPHSDTPGAFVDTGVLMKAGSGSTGTNVDRTAVTIDSATVSDRYLQTRPAITVVNRRGGPAPG